MSEHGGEVGLARATLAILRKDLRIELRTREAVPAMALFAVTAFVLFHFGLDRDRLEGDVAAGVLWVTLLLAAVLGVGRLFVAEREQGGMEAMLLAPVDRTAIYLAKAGALLAYLVLLEIIAVPALVGALAAETRAREVIGPLLLLPLVVPLAIAGARATEPLLSGTGEPAELDRWLGLMALYASVFMLLSVALFDYLIED